MRTANLGLPLLAASQAQKHVTLNEALVALDALTQIHVTGAVSTPPDDPAPGARYLVASPASGVFAGADDAVAIYDEGAWSLFAPKAGWLAYDESLGRLRLYDGGRWTELPAPALRQFAIGATADDDNRLAVSSPAVLFDHAGDDIRLKLDKAAAENFASLLFQTDYSGRAEIGLAGDDNFRVKVSTDGENWSDALIVDAASGAVTLPATTNRPGGLAGLDAAARLAAAQLPPEARMAGFRNRLRNARFTVNQRQVAGTVVLTAGQYGHDGVKAGAAGARYRFQADGADYAIELLDGALILPVENEWIEGGDFTLAQDSTAPARIWQGDGNIGVGRFASAARASGGLRVVGLTPGAQTNVEFAPGVILRPQLEPGALATPFERRPAATELGLCQRYFEKSYASGRPPGAAVGAGYNSLQLSANGGGGIFCMAFKATKRATPTFAIYDGAGAAGCVSYYNGAWRNGAGPANIYVAGSDSIVTFNLYSTIAGLSAFGFDWTASAEL